MANTNFRENGRQKNYDLAKSQSQKKKKGKPVKVINYTIY